MCVCMCPLPSQAHTWVRLYARTHARTHTHTHTHTHTNRGVLHAVRRADISKHVCSFYSKFYIFSLQVDMSASVVVDFISSRNLYKRERYSCRCHGNRLAVRVSIATNRPSDLPTQLQPATTTCKTTTTTYRFCVGRFTHST